MHRLILLVLVLVACGDPASSPLLDAAPDAEPSNHCPETPADPSASGRYVVFLAAEGIELNAGNGCDNSQTNCTKLLQEPAIIPAALAGEPTRDAVIAEIVELTSSRLAPYSVDVVTTRPSSGDYNMIVFGGDPVSVGLSSDLGGQAPFDCGSAYENHIALMFDRGLTDVTATNYANMMLFLIGSFEGLTLTRTTGDCMCQLDTECQPGMGTLCTFTESPTSVVFPTCGRAVQDGPAMLKGSLGCR